MSRPTLLILTPGFPSDESDTTCLPAHQCFVRALNTVFPDLELVIVAFQYPYRSGRYTWHGNTVIAFNGKLIPKWRRPLFWIKSWLRLNAMNPQGMIGVLSFWCLEEALVAKFFSNHHRLAHLSWLCGQDARLNNRYFKLVRPKAQQLVAMSPFLADETEKNFGVRPAYIIPNAIDPAEYAPASGERTIDILGVGSLIALKQYTVFVEVVAELVKKNPSLKAVLCGAGPEREKLERMIGDLGLKGNLSLQGECPRAEVLSYMQRAKILLHPSTYEGYSTVCLEALYAGCYVVSFILPEKRDISHWHGVADRAEMTAKCETILSEETDFAPVLVHDMHDSARAMLKLFNYPPMA
jgi:glycosyltransferase involved in cell wall biosynthesis